MVSKEPRTGNKPRSNIPEERKAGVMGKIVASDPKVPRTSQWRIRMRRLPFGLIPRTLPDGELSHSRVPSLIQTYFVTHTVDVVFLRDEERLLYEEMLRLHGLGTYTDDQIMAIVRWGKQRGHILGVGRVLTGRGRDVLLSPEPRCMHTVDVDELKRTNKQLKKQMDMIMKLVRCDDKMFQLLTQLQSQHEVGSGNGSGASEDDESSDDEDADEDEDS
nr:hypothetical protein [Tanacetum cinerariifolium]